MNNSQNMAFDHFPFCIYLYTQELCFHPGGQSPSPAVGFLLTDLPPDMEGIDVRFTSLAFSVPFSPSFPASSELDYYTFFSTYWFGHFPILLHFLISG